jgi:hypothetical protein
MKVKSATGEGGPASNKKKPGPSKKMLGPEVFKDPASAARKKNNGDEGGDDDDDVMDDNDYDDAKQKKDKKRKMTKKDKLEEGAAAVQAYMQEGARGRPSEEVLSQFDKIPYAAQLCAAESTGFAEHDLDLLHEQITSPNKAVRDHAIDELAKFGKTFGPSGPEQNEIRDAFYRNGADHHRQLQNCCVK